VTFGSACFGIALLLTHYLKGLKQVLLLLLTIDVTRRCLGLCLLTVLSRAQEPNGPQWNPFPLSTHETQQHHTTHTEAYKLSWCVLHKHLCCSSFLEFSLLFILQYRLCYLTAFLFGLTDASWNTQVMLCCSWCSRCSWCSWCF